MSENKIEIRPATMNDIPEIILCARDFYKFAQLEKSGLQYSPGRFLLFVEWLIENPATCFFAGFVDGVFAGGIAGLLCPWFLDSMQLTATEQFWWVDPDYRGGPLAKELLRQFENWAKENGASHVFMISLEVGRKKALDRVYRGLSYEPLEVLYGRRL